MPSSLIHDQLNTAALVALIAQENDPTERQRLRIQLGFTDIVDKLLQRAESHEREMGIKFAGYEDRLDDIEPIVYKHQETITSWKANLRLLLFLFASFNTGLGFVVYKAWNITTTMYEEVKELTVVVPKLKALNEEAKLQTKALAETKSVIEENKAVVNDQLDSAKVTDSRVEELNQELNRIKKLKVVRGSR